MSNIFKSLFSKKKRIQPLNEEDLKRNIDNLKIIGFKLPEGILNRIKEDNWKVPKDKKNLKELIIENAPFEEGKNWSNSFVNNLYLYQLRTMVTESEHLVNWLHPKWKKDRIVYLGKKDKNVYPGNIEPNKVILFADFGLGSDTAFGLDYREDKDNPIVILEYWGKNPETDNRWKKIANSFDEFEKRIWK